MRRAVLCAALMAMFLPCSAGAQSVMLTEADALARLSTDSPRVRAIRSGVDVARVDVLAAGRWPNPRLTVDRESVAGVTEYLTMIAQPLPVTGRRDLEVQAASARVAAVASRADDDVRRLRADLRLAFGDLLSAQVRVAELTAARDRLRALADVLAKRESAGDAAGFDRLRADREAFDIETDLALATTDRSRAQAALAGFLTGVTDATQLVAAARSTTSVDPVPSVDALLARAESTRGELQALRHDAKGAKFAARAADRRLVPEPEVVAGTKSSTLGTGEIGSVFTVHASIPLFDHARPERALASARAAEADARTEAFRQVLRSQVAALRAVVTERRDVAERYRAQAVAGAAQIERIAQVSYDAGERGILELLDAYRIGATARVRQAALDLAVRQAEIELEFITGWEAPL
ncbi:MAG TPA: TolC family protein [Vicinamibacterales bacterium]|jgi:cobalt-zinc-cadmium efflux system outer membrane protein